ncbi:hypothetical protein [Aquimarina aggregata]|uniref:hypothetical protein n=1 Tax=Aquimarina aggregata TaxID=1642818 RepID=UPI0024929A7F|nr:hypothetical protein [Aquimarina aggregata]
MKPLFSVYVVLILSMISCSNDDDSNDAIASGLNGKWNLVNISGGFTGIDHDFANGTIVWDFNETNNMVTVTNNNTDTTISDILPSGTYSYSIVDKESIKELIVNDINRGTFEMTNDEFIINEQFRDGFRVVFRR